MLHTPLNRALNSPARSTCTRLLSPTLARILIKKRNAVGGGRKLAALALSARKSCPLGTSLASLAHESTCATHRNWPARAGPRKKPHPGGRDLAALAPASSKALACTAALATVAPAGDRGILSWDPHSPHSHDASAGVSIPVHENSERVLCDAMRLATLANRLRFHRRVWRVSARTGRHPRRSHRECAKSGWREDGRTRRTRRTRSRNGENTRCGHDTLTLKPLTLSLTLTSKPGETESEMKSRAPAKLLQAKNL